MRRGCRHCAEVAAISLSGTDLTRPPIYGRRRPATTTAWRQPSAGQAAWEVAFQAARAPATTAVPARGATPHSHGASVHTSSARYRASAESSAAGCSSRRAVSGANTGANGSTQPVPCRGRQVQRAPRANRLRRRQAAAAAGTPAARRKRPPEGHKPMQPATPTLAGAPKQPNGQSGATVLHRARPIVDGTVGEVHGALTPDVPLVITLRLKEGKQPACRPTAPTES